MPNYQTAFRIFVVSFIAVLSLVCVLHADAQSGRRTKKTSAPILVAAEEPMPPKAAEKPKPALTLIVGMERFDSFGPNVSNPGTLLMAVTDRLDDSSAVRVVPVSGNFNRSDAIRRAKKEEAAYVVLLELEEESRIVITTTIRETSIQYSVFSPTTAKLKAFGRTYPQVARGGGVILRPRRDDIYGDYQLQQAARHAAEKILKAFDLPLPNSGLVARQD